jgi:hypothetical protein
MSRTKNVTISGIEFPNANEAIQHTEASGRGSAISIGDKVLVVEQAEADRLAIAGVEFAYLVDHEMPDGSHRIMTIPVND